MKKLTIEELKSICFGAVNIYEENGYISFHRFTPKQEELYRRKKGDLYSKVFSNSGMKLMFKTNSEYLYMDILVKSASSRNYFSIDVYSEDKLIGMINNYKNEKLDDKNIKAEFPLGNFPEKFFLGKGEKNIVIYFPWSVSVSIKELSIDENSTLIPKKQRKKMLMFGDSITQGYDALKQKNRYASRVAEEFFCEEINKAIGGDCFFPELAEIKEDFVPDYITVAYGTNDWNKIKREEFEVNCKAFFNALRTNYPDTVIFALAPIWRASCEELHDGWKFSDVADYIQKTTSEIKNIIFIDCFSFVPHRSDFFADLILHPNDEGFMHYQKNLLKIMKEYIKGE